MIGALAAGIAALLVAAAPAPVVLATIDGNAAQGADAYLRYVDTELGGVNGRQVTLDVSGVADTVGELPDLEPSARAQASAFGRYLAALAPTKQIAVLYDAPETLAALKRGLGKRKANVVSATLVDETTDVALATAGAKASGATVLCLLAGADDALAALPALRWRPQLLVRGAATPAEGAIAATNLKNVTDPVWATDPGIVLYRRILVRYAKGAPPRDPALLAGMASAFAAVDALRHAGATPTAAAYPRALARLDEPNNPFLLPGIRVRPASGTAQLQLERWSKGRWRNVGGLLTVEA